MLRTLIQIAIAIICFWLIFVYLLPLLPGVIHTIVFIILVLAAIIWLLHIAGVEV